MRVRADLAGLAGEGGSGVVPVRLAPRSDATLVRVGAVVVKAHAPGTKAAALAARLRVAAHPALAGILLPPLPPARVRALPGGRSATLWPYGVPVDPGADELPWEAAGALLALLHAVDPAALGPGALPAAGGPTRAAEAVARLRAAPGAGTADERRAVERVLAGARAEPARLALCHGDFHFGQLVADPAGGDGLLLIDVDDLGVGDPAWDLARPAAWFAAGLVPEPDWRRFLAGYGVAEPWPDWLDGPARALTAQLAARALLTGRPLSEEGAAFVDACRRIDALT
ncbi:phosphotransferase [Streptomyces sp. 8K308]|uniref:phosphotransferase family protein n=1 Tax=Streptomyces sp. 8K308 TaxID=2530388 RepID=UPI001FB63C15|nr:phosphotransferase [Streptomyces sp. 8K308]